MKDDGGKDVAEGEARYRTRFTGESCESRFTGEHFQTFV